MVVEGSTKANLLSSFYLQKCVIYTNRGEIQQGGCVGSSTYVGAARTIISAREIENLLGLLLNSIWLFLKSSLTHVMFLNSYIITNRINMLFELLVQI